MHYPSPGRLIQIGLLFLCFNSSASAQGGFLGIGGDEQTPSLTLAPAQIAVDVPTPVHGNNLALLLAQAGSGNSLSALKEKAAQKFSDQLRRELHRRLEEFFADEEVPLLREGGLLTLHSFVDITVSKQLSDLKNSDRYELERGSLGLAGEFRYQLQNAAGQPLRERRIDIGELRVRENYRVKTPHDGGEVEDSTDEAITEALAEVVKRLQDRIEDQLEADTLRELAAL
ncbi:hypothetical protein [Microbulbifer taiwanensis]|uniref:Uncharacterized protein n=1 Tax=Microbulbifer taiwanensis TaxID=986746 RepID=A0ABW1YN07_9GAMM|nr:hypothetical protein [Microbulbifer taiwanensis]